MRVYAVGQGAVSLLDDVQMFTTLMKQRRDQAAQNSSLALGLTQPQPVARTHALLGLDGVF